MSEMTEAYEWQGRTIVGSDGEKIGKVGEIYLDGETNKPEWATVSSGLFGKNSHFVPLADASPDGEDVRVQVSREQVKDAPSVDPEGELSEQEERQLFEHYGVPYTTAGGTTAQGAPQGSASRSDDAMTRSEEEVHVSTASREAGRARLRKYVVAEQVQQTVPVSREEVRVEREPIGDENIDDATAGPEISEGEHEVVLHEEEVVVEKRAVPKERVRLGKETTTDEREVSEEVRKERIEAEGAQQR